MTAKDIPRRFAAIAASTPANSLARRQLPDPLRRRGASPLRRIAPPQRRPRQAHACIDHRWWSNRHRSTPEHPPRKGDPLPKGSLPSRHVRRGGGPRTSRRRRRPIQVAAATADAAVKAASHSLAPAGGRRRGASPPAHRPAWNSWPTSWSWGTYAPPRKACAGRRLPPRGGSTALVPCMAVVAPAPPRPPPTRLHRIAPTASRAARLAGWQPRCGPCLRPQRQRCDMSSRPHRGVVDRRRSCRNGQCGDSRGGGGGAAARWRGGAARSSPVPRKQQLDPDAAAVARWHPPPPRPPPTVGRTARRHVPGGGGATSAATATAAVSEAAAPLPDAMAPAATGRRPREAGPRHEPPLTAAAGAACCDAGGTVVADAGGCPF